MSKQVISCQDAPAAIGPYSQGISAGNLVFIAGQIPLDAKTGQLVSGGIREQTAQVLENIAAILKAVDLGLENIVKTTVYLADLADFTEFNGIYGQYFTDKPPSRATIQVAGLPRGARVEIEAIATNG